MCESKLSDRERERERERELNSHIPMFRPKQQVMRYVVAEARSSIINIRHFNCSPKFSFPYK